METDLVPEPFSDARGEERRGAVGLDEIDVALIRAADEFDRDEDARIHQIVVMGVRRRVASRAARFEMPTALTSAPAKRSAAPTYIARWNASVD